MALFLLQMTDLYKATAYRRARHAGLHGEDPLHLTWAVKQALRNGAVPNKRALQFLRPQRSHAKKRSQHHDNDTDPALIKCEANRHIPKDIPPFDGLQALPAIPKHGRDYVINIS